MPKAIWNGHVIAETDTFEIVEGNIYFPQKSIDCAYFQPSRKTTECGWKGTANYYNLVNGDAVSQDAAWYYAEPKAQASNIQGHIAFGRTVTVEQ